MALVTISKFNQVHEAELARLALQSEGIPAFVIDAYTGGNLREMIAGGIRLQVDERDVDAADAVLNRLSGVDGAEEAAPGDAGPWQPPQTCPSCGAPEVARRQKLVAFVTVAAFILAIAYTQDATLLGFFLVVAAAIFFLVASSWRCRHCGHTW
jgi:hypothetical protein